MSQSLYQANIANALFPITVSVSTLASASVQSGYRGFFFITSASLSFVTPNDQTITIDNFPKNSFLWIQAKFVNVIATATSVFGVM